MRNPTTALLAALFCACTGARADEFATVSLSGFGTLGALYHGAEGVKYRRDVSVPDGASARRWSLAQDSMLGVQATARFGEHLEATLQLTIRDSIDRGYTPQVSLGFVKWKPDAATTLRAGRIGLEVYQRGDSSEIGYANPMVRPIFGLYPRTADGVDAEWLTPIGPMGGGILRVKSQAGYVVGKMTTGGETIDVSGSPMVDFLAEYTQGSWTGRVAAGKSTSRGGPDSESFRALCTALSATPRGAEILDSLTQKGRATTAYAIGLRYDSGPFQAQADYARVTWQSGWPTQAYSALQGGYRISRFTPYAGYTYMRTERRLIETGLPWNVATYALNQGAALAQAAHFTNQTIATAGLRYELSRNTALKFQVDAIRYQDTPSIFDPTLLTEDVAGRGFKAITLYSVALEFVF